MSRAAHDTALYWRKAWVCVQNGTHHNKERTHTCEEKELGVDPDI